MVIDRVSAAVSTLVIQAVTSTRSGLSKSPKNALLIGAVPAGDVATHTGGDADDQHHEADDQASHADGPYPVQTDPP